MAKTPSHQIWDNRIIANPCDAFLSHHVSLAALTLAACGGGGGGTKIANTTTTVGQELVDLKRAYDQGVISKSDYDDQRQKILDR